jgi:adenylate cyclase
MAINPDDNVAHYNLACMYSLLGEPDLALDHLERVLERVVPHMSGERMA